MAGTVVPLPPGLTAMVRVKGISSKCAVTVLLASTVTVVAGLVGLPTAPPVLVQLTKRYPPAGVALMSTTVLGA